MFNKPFTLSVRIIAIVLIHKASMSMKPAFYVFVIRPLGSTFNKSIQSTVELLCHEVS